MKKGLFNISLEEYPIGFIGTCLGAVSLAGVFTKLGVPIIQEIFIYIGCLALLIGLAKVIFRFKTVWKEMNTTLVMALFPTSTMLLMNIGVYFSKFNYSFGKGLWLFALLLNVFFVVFFLIRHVIIGFNIKNKLPCWYVLLVGISVSCVTSEPMHAQALVKPVFYFVVIAFLTSLPVMIYRLITVEVPDAQYPLIAVFAAPGSLCTISYLTLYKNPNIYLVSFFFALSLAAVIYDYLNFPRFFSLKFNVTFGALTFPLAIALVAAIKVHAYLVKYGFHTYATVMKGIVGIELFVTTGVIAFVFFNFVFNHLLNVPKLKLTR